MKQNFKPEWKCLLLCVFCIMLGLFIGLNYSSDPFKFGQYQMKRKGAGKNNFKSMNEIIEFKRGGTYAIRDENTNALYGKWRRKDNLIIVSDLSTKDGLMPGNMSNELRGERGSFFYIIEANGDLTLAIPNLPFIEMSTYHHR